MSLFIIYIQSVFIKFNNVLIYLLIGAAVITTLQADWIDAGVILGVVIFNPIPGFIQERKAEKAADAIRNILTLETIVMRDQQKHTVENSILMPES